jgi:hypothetical protein
VPIGIPPKMGEKVKIVNYNEWLSYSYVYVQDREGSTDIGRQKS